MRVEDVSEVCLDLQQLMSLLLALLLQLLDNGLALLKCRGFGATGVDSTPSDWLTNAVVISVVIAVC